MCYEDGGCVDDLIVYKVRDEHYFIVVNAANKDKDFAWMKAHEQDVEGLFRAALHGFPKGQEALELFIAGIAPPYGEPQQSHEQGHKYRATDKFTHGAPTRDTGDEAACERNIRNIP